jgi:hypothetical protein
MSLATSNRSQLRFIKETVFGTTPVAGNPNNLRMTGESLSFAINTDTSKEIRSDRQVTDLIPMIEAIMQSTYTVFGVNGVGVAIPTSATFAAGALTAGAATSGASIFTSLVMGQWVKISGSSIPAQNIWAQVSLTVPPTATVLTFQGTPFTAATGAGGAAVTVSASRISNGTTLNSYTIERAVMDATVAQFFAYRGMCASKLSLKFAAGSVVGGSFGFMGKDAIRQDTTTTLPGSPIASKTLDVMNAVVVGTGTLQVSGTMEVYLADGAMWDKFRNNTSSALSLRATDGAGNGYVITLPKIKYGDAKINAGSIDQDLMLSMPFTAIMDPVSSKTIIIDRAGIAAT